jgi:prepilin-type N-terminal cleavage/methylation domain-containing protein
MRVLTRSLRRLGAFTLIELLTVMAVIAILAGLILSIAGYVQKKGAMQRASAEISALSLACQNYKSDNGAYPELVPPSSSGMTSYGSATVNVSADSSNVPSDNLDPRTMGNPSTLYGSGAAGSGVSYGNIQNLQSSASLELYVALSGDVSLSGTGGGPGSHNYIQDFRPDALGRAYTNASVSGTNPVQYFGDPFGNPYGYSTANNFFQQYAQTVGSGKPNYPEGLGGPPGYSPTFDLWSTAGNTANPYTGSGTTNGAGSPGDPELGWVKSWGP